MLRSVLTGLIIMGFAFATPALAQTGGFGDIFGDIPNPGGPYPEAEFPETSGLIDNIPVNVRIDDRFELDGKLLIVSAYAPPPASGSISPPRLLGETRLLMTGLTQHMQIIVAAPGPVTANIDFARLEAKVLDENGNPVLTSRTYGVFRGDSPADLELVALDVESGPEVPALPSGLETATGTVVIPTDSDMFAGSSLTLQLIETGLAGAPAKVIAAETILDLDGRTAPFDFEIERAVSGDEETPLAFDAWISDWAGRKTHIMEKPKPYSGPDQNYTLTLDALRTEKPPETNQITGSEAASEVIITGEAIFDAYKGLPAGSRMTVSLNRTVSAFGAKRELASRTILLDGLSGNVKFDLVADSKHFDPLVPPPVLNIRLTDSAGRLFFSSGDVPAADGFNAIQLTPSPIY